MTEFDASDDRNTLLVLKMKGLSERNTQAEKFLFSKSTTICFACNSTNRNFITLTCDHTFCEICLEKFCRIQFENLNLNIFCPVCTIPLSEKEISFVHPEYSKTLDERFHQSLLKDNQTIISCPKCNEAFIYESGEVAGITKDQFGVPIRADALECLRLNRATCFKCQTVFCVSCHQVPFHDGFTCEEQSLIAKGIVCRFCGSPASGCDPNSDACHRLCWRPECRAMIDHACTHVCECGHACSGIRDEEEHFGCGECSYACCVICKDMCSAKPSVKMLCGHDAHQECLISLFQSKNMTGRLKVPRCGYGCRAVPMHRCVAEIAKSWQEIDEKIEKITEEVMVLEDTKEEKEHVKNPLDEYFEKPLDFAHDFFDFYMCEQCHTPFYGGHKDCAREEEENVHYKCSRCQRQFLNTNCPIHGEKGMVFKCFYCCNPVLFICGGTTYYCNECHSRPVVKPCDGHCAFAPHSPNGERVITCYCVLCEDEKIKLFNNK